MSVMHALTGRSLLLRSLLTTVLVAALTGLASLGYTTQVIAERTRADAQLRLTQLLDTLERAVQAACFTQDEALAREIAVGLLNNSEVLAVSIREGNTLLAREQRHSLSRSTANPPLPP